MNPSPIRYIQLYLIGASKSSEFDFGKTGVDVCGVNAADIRAGGECMILNVFVHIQSQYTIARVFVQLRFAFLSLRFPRLWHARFGSAFR